MIKKLILLSAIPILIYFYRNDINKLINDKLYFSHCDNTIDYFIHSVDAKFGITREKVIEDTKAAAEIWNKNYNSTLFQYNEEKGIPISLIFDDRQRLLTSISQNSSNVETEKQVLDKAIEEFENEKSKLLIKYDALQLEIKKWNDKGGAPTDVYNKLTKEVNNIVNQINYLNDKAEALNRTSSDVNKDINTLNNNITEFNNLIDVKPEGGIYDGNKKVIEIYFYDSSNQYKHIAAHELGHALGIVHLANTKAIMAPVISETTELTEDDKNQLQDFCRPISYVDYFKELLINKY